MQTKTLFKLPGQLLAASAVVAISLATSLTLAKPDNVDGYNVPQNRKLQMIENNQYPRSYYPNTEKLSEDEMRVTALGTGMPTQTPSDKAAAFMVELGNGEVFMFDLGTGSTDNLSALQPDYSKINKVFASHLHTDHIGDLASLWIGGWIGGRYVPLEVWGPSGARPELGTQTMIDGIRTAWQWDIETRSGILPDEGGQIIAHEFDYKTVQVVYDRNGVKVTAFPAIHIMDGPVSYRLDWNGRSFVFGGDSFPNKWFVEHAQNADLVVHESFFTPEQWMRVASFPYKKAYWVTSKIHTPPEGFGKIMSAVKPRMAVAYHYWNHRDIEFEMHEKIRTTYDGPLTMAKDMTVWNVTADHIETRQVSFNHEAWAQGPGINWVKAPRSAVSTQKMSKYMMDGRLGDFVPPPNPAMMK
jgi:ribonuclease Z